MASSLEDALRQIAAATAANLQSQASADARLAAVADNVQQQMAAMANNAQQQQAAAAQQQQQLQQAFVQVSDALQQSQQQQQAMSAEILRLQQSIAANASGTGAAAAAAAASAASAPGTGVAGAAGGLIVGRSLIDTKGLGTPAKFNGVSPKFQIWSTKLVSWLSATYENAEKIMEKCAHHGETAIDATAVTRYERDLPGSEHLNKHLLTLLTALCEDGAFTLVQNGRPNGGLDSWRRLTRRYDPQTPMKSVFALMKLLSQVAVPLERLLETIEAWEESYRVWAQSSKMDLPDIVRQMALIMMTSEPLRGHIELTIENYDDYDELRTYIERFVTTKMAKNGDNDMDIGALTSSSKSDIRCHWCDKTGHVVKECRLKLAGKPKTAEALARQEALKKKKDQQSKSGSSSSSTWSNHGGGKGKKTGKGKGKGVNGLDADDNQSSQQGEWWTSSTWHSYAEQDEAGPEVGGISLNTLVLGQGLGVGAELLRLAAGGARWCGRDQYGWYFDATVDSGAAATVGPESLAVKLPLMPSRFAGQSFTTANGEPILPMGLRKVEFVTYGGIAVNLKIEICSVDKFLLSVDDLVEQGHEAIFSYRPRIVLKNKKEVAMRRERRLFFLRLYLVDNSLMAIDAVDGQGVEGPVAAPAQPFHRLVQ